MIIAWFTQPANSFSSYYQYDLNTRKFSRIRLELGRGGDRSETFVSYKENRAVGFSGNRLNTRNLDAWSVNEDGDLCYNDQLLIDRPVPNARTYDCTPGPDGITFVHVGNPVTQAPNLPAGIEAKHLALLANDAMLTGQTTDLTPSTATAEELSTALKQRVCEVTGVQDFANVTDQIILDKLTEQAGLISAAASQPEVDNLDQALATAEDENRIINKQIENGQFTPTEAFENAFTTLQQAIQDAQGATAGNDLAAALESLTQAQTSLAQVLTQVDAASAELVRNQLEAAGRALETAQANAGRWEEINEIYEPLETAESVAEYEAEIFSEPEIVP